MKEQTVLGMFAEAGIPVLSRWKIENQYWPEVEEYEDVRKKSPWWLIKTPKGLIEIGWRKRVISIDWKDTGIRKIVTDENVTKDNYSVHAWSEESAILYLNQLAPEIAQPVAPGDSMESGR